MIPVDKFVTMGRNIDKVLKRGLSENVAKKHIIREMKDYNFEVDILRRDNVDIRHIDREYTYEFRLPYWIRIIVDNTSIFSYFIFYLDSGRLRFGSYWKTNDLKITDSNPYDGIEDFSLKDIDIFLNLLGDVDFGNVDVHRWSEFLNDRGKKFRDWDEDDFLMCKMSM